MAQVKALEAARVSSLSALEANKLGYEVGVRINIDVLNAQTQLADTLQQLSRALRHPARPTSSEGGGGDAGRGWRRRDQRLADGVSHTHRARSGRVTKRSTQFPLLMAPGCSGLKGVISRR